MEQGRHNLVIDASPKEKTEIEAALTTRQRTEILLAAARSVPPNISTHGRGDKCQKNESVHFVEVGTLIQ